MDEFTRHRWIATHILPLEGQARRWLSRHVRSITPSDADDLIQESYSRIWSIDLNSIHNPVPIEDQSIKENVFREMRQGLQTAGAKIADVGTANRVRANN